jgi:hypothetical protein
MCSASGQPELGLNLGPHESCQTSNFTGSGVAVDQTTRSRFVQKGLSLLKQASHVSSLTFFNRITDFFNSGANAGNISLVLASFLSVYKDTLFCGFMLCHCVVPLSSSISESMSNNKPDAIRQALYFVVTGIQAA